MLNPALVLGAKLVLMPRFHVEQLTAVMIEEAITMMPLYRLPLTRSARPPKPDGSRASIK